jgi:hypothetical protein
MLVQAPPTHPPTPWLRQVRPLYQPCEFTTTPQPPTQTRPACVARLANLSRMVERLMAVEHGLEFDANGPMEGCQRGASCTTPQKSITWRESDFLVELIIIFFKIYEN